jgi:hypothetical protein
MILQLLQMRNYGIDCERNFTFQKMEFGFSFHPFIIKKSIGKI